MRSALTQVDEIKDLKTSPSISGGICTFKVAKDFDYKAKLNEFAGKNSHIKGWMLAKK